MMNSKEQSQAFDNNYQKAQQNSWQTGQLGTSKYYVDNNQNMHIGNGQLSGSFTTLNNYQRIKTINLDSNVQASSNFPQVFGHTSFDGTTNITNINGLGRLDTSQVTNMGALFYGNNKMTNLDLSDLNISSSVRTYNMFGNNNFHQITLGNNTRINGNGINGADNDSKLNGTYKNDIGQTLNLDGNAHPGTWVKQ